MRNSRTEFIALAVFVVGATLILTNGFSARIFAQDKQPDFYQMEPIGVVVDEIQKSYVRQPDLDHIVEGAITGMMNNLDEHSSFISADDFKRMTEETRGEFEGIGISISSDPETGLIAVFAPIEGSPAAKAGIIGGDLIFKIDEEGTKGMALSEAANRIRGPKGTMVHLTLLRRFDNPETEPEVLELDVKRDTVPLISLTESRMLEGAIGYIRLGDFKETTAHELVDKIREFEKLGMKSLIFDLRWNPGGLLTAAREVSELFLPENTLVTYTQGRSLDGGGFSENLRLFTERPAIVPDNFPLVILVNEHTASSAEIVTGALQYHGRALIVGEKTYGKGSVQTIIPLARPKDSALRLTTALYYTPAEVTIDHHGILPDVHVPMDKEQWMQLLRQMRDSMMSDDMDHQNHGAVTGDAVTDTTVEDLQLQRGVEILKEDKVWQNLIKKYHRDPHETQVAAAPDETEHDKAAKDAPKAANN